MVPLATPVQEYEVTVQGCTVRYRLPNSTDLASITRQRDALVARDLLLSRCVTQAYRDGVVVEITTLPEEVIAGVGIHMQVVDLQSEVLLGLNCPGCAHNWSVMFDIVSFFWSEIGAQARRFMREVHILASAYGWSEADILTLSAARRQFYLEMVMQ